MPANSSPAKVETDSAAMMIFGALRSTIANPDSVCSRSPATSSVPPDEFLFARPLANARVISQDWLALGPLVVTTSG